MCPGAAPAGRPRSVAAVASANESNAALVVLAVLDPDAFSDLDESLRGDGPLRGTRVADRGSGRVGKNPAGHQGLETRVIVRRGDVSAEVLDVAQKCGAGAVLVAHQRRSAAMNRWTPSWLTFKNDCSATVLLV